MKLAICIPAFNEEKTIGQVIGSVPGQIQGFSTVKIFVIDDGSADHTAQYAAHAGAEIIAISPNQGLAHAFFTGIQKALAWGADVIVNIDGDAQYRAEEIPLLVAPILADEADMAVGDRQIKALRFMSRAKKYGNLAGSWFLRKLTGSRVRDASSGFRAYSRAAAKTIEIHSKHTYTHENLIQAHYLGLRIAQVPVTFIARAAGTSSRLITGVVLGGVLKHIFKSLRGIFAAWRRWRRK
jgi:glycosyltransferase involved in cell wall biosynthesis